MRPSLRPGLSLIVDLNPFQPRLGDVVMIRCGQEWVVHRVVQTPSQTKGDWSAVLDEKGAPVGRVIGYQSARHSVRWRNGRQPLARVFVPFSNALINAPWLLRWGARVALIFTAGLSRALSLYSSSKRQSPSPAA